MSKICDQQKQPNVEEEETVPSAGERAASGAVPNPRSGKTPRFWAEFLKELVSALVVIPIAGIFVSLLPVESKGIEFIAAPAILAWLAIRGWKTDNVTWPLRLRLWRFVPVFLIRALIIVGPPLLFWSIVYGLVLLLKFHRPPYVLIVGYTAAVLASSALVWTGRTTAIRLGMSLLGLSRATVTEKVRFGLCSLVLLALATSAVWPRPAEFATICEAARRAGSVIAGPVGTSLQGMQFSECVVRARGAGYAVTIGAVSDGKRDKPAKVIRYTAVVYASGEAHHIELNRGDPRD